MYVCMLYVCMYVRTYVCMYVCMDGWMDDGWMDVCMCIDVMMSSDLCIYVPWLLKGCPGPLLCEGVHQSAARHHLGKSGL